jgi:low affinity Fe/Cu permease
MPSKKASHRNAAHHQGAFAQVASTIAHVAGKPVTFLTAAALVVAWAVSGPLFGFSDTWQLVINTSTTIVTFLMVFLNGADDKLTAAEDLSDEELERLHRHYKQRAEATMDSLDRRRGDKPQAA